MADPAMRPPKDAKVPNSANKGVPLNVQSYRQATPNLSRTFALTPHAAKDSVQTLGVNVRAANVLNHTNVRQVGGVPGSPLFGKAYGADTGRRIEFGLRYSL